MKKKKSSELETITSNVQGLNNKIYRLQNQRRKYQTQIGHLINQNQVYRLAMYAYGVSSAKDVDRGMVGIVAFLWFGSLSLITAVTGVMLALAGFYLRGLRGDNKDADSEIAPETVAKSVSETAPEAANDPSPEHPPATNPNRLRLRPAMSVRSTRGCKEPRFGDFDIKKGKDERGGVEV